MIPAGRLQWLQAWPDPQEWVIKATARHNSPADKLEYEALRPKYIAWLKAAHIDTRLDGPLWERAVTRGTAWALDVPEGASRIRFQPRIYLSSEELYDRWSASAMGFAIVAPHLTPHLTPMEQRWLLLKADENVP